MHAVGFLGHSGIYKESVMGFPKEKYIFPYIDKKVIKMLYNSGIPIGVDIETTKAFFEAMKLFYNKHYSKRYFFALKWLVFLGINSVKLWKIVKIKFS